MNTQFTLPDDTSIRYVRRFAAPIDRVWAGYTEPDIVRQWMLGPPDDNATLEVCDMDIRPGGSYRWVWQSPEGKLEISGDVQEAEPPRRLVSIERWAGVDAPPMRSVVEFAEQGDDTVMTGTLTFDTVELRDAAYATGMAEGMDWGFARLAELV